MNEVDDVERESSSPLDFGVADVITTTIVYLTCTVAVYLLCTFVEDDVDEAVTRAPDGTGTQATVPPAASVASETPVAGARTAASLKPPPAPTMARPPAETGGASAAAVPDIMGREKRRR